jgi:hypothetical protein
MAGNFAGIPAVEGAVSSVWVLDQHFIHTQYVNPIWEKGPPEVYNASECQPVFVYDYGATGQATPGVLTCLNNMGSRELKECNGDREKAKKLLWSRCRVVGFIPQGGGVVVAGTPSTKQNITVHIAGKYNTQRVPESMEAGKLAFWKLPTDEEIKKKRTENDYRKGHPSKILPVIECDRDGSGKRSNNDAVNSLNDYFNNQSDFQASFDTFNKENGWVSIAHNMDQFIAAAVASHLRMFITAGFLTVPEYYTNSAGNTARTEDHTGALGDFYPDSRELSDRESILVPHITAVLAKAKDYTPQVLAKDIIDVVKRQTSSAPSSQERQQEALDFVTKFLKSKRMIPVQRNELAGSQAEMDLRLKEAALSIFVPGDPKRNHIDAFQPRNIDEIFSGNSPSMRDSADCVRTLMWNAARGLFGSIKALASIEKRHFAGLISKGADINGNADLYLS